MKLLGRTKKLDIVTDDWQSSMEDGLTEYPLYRPNYISGIRNIFQEAIEQSVAEETDKKRSVAYEKKRIIANEKRNILSFIGKRGAGKTTAMDEFCRILKFMGDEEIKHRWMELTLEEDEKRKLWEKRFHFRILKPIDAALLEEKEDLFELILVNIYHAYEEKLKKTDRALGRPKAREITELFTDILRMYDNVREKRRREETGSYIMDMMGFMAGSFEIQDRLAVLIEELLLLEDTKCDYEYLVVAIDDLDLNLRHGYEMLEQLQKYFSYYRVLILITLDYTQMGIVCEEHFYEEMKYTIGKPLPEYASYGKAVVSDYMTKIFHYSQRMYMPNAKKIIKKAEIKFNKGTEMAPDIHKVPTKKFIMVKIAESMRIFYDGCGLKRHFCEAETVRNLVSYNEFLESMIPIEYGQLVRAEKIAESSDEYAGSRNMEILRKYDHNHERFNEDIAVRMVQNTLSQEQKRAFEALHAKGLERRAMYFVRAMRQDAVIRVGDIKENEYSYGSLLYKIYGWGRRAYEDKPFISCMLASFTSEMVREYISYRYHPDAEKRERYRKRLVQFMGKSFGNEWTGKAFPVTNIMVNTDDNGPEIPMPVRYGYAKAETRGLEIQVDMEDVLKRLQKLGIKELRRNVQGSEEKATKQRPRKVRGTEMKAESDGLGLQSYRDTIKTWLKKEKIIESLECIDMFFSEREETTFRGISYTFRKAVRRDQEGEKNQEERLRNRAVMIGADNETLVLDLMAFVPKSIDYRTERERLLKNISEGISNVISDYLGIQTGSPEAGNLEGIIREAVEEYSLLKKYEESPGFEYETAFPFYNLDMSYNIFKRVQENYPRDAVKEDGLIPGIVRFYEYIEKLLKEEQSYYHEFIQPDYLDSFQSCPYIKLIKQIAEKEDSEELNKIKTRVTDAFRNMAPAKPTRVVFE